MNVPIFNHHDFQAEPSRIPPQQLASAHQVRGPSQNTDVVGRPIHFVGGQFAGQTVRAELHEVQKADLGRKYARVDRRPLDPPPVVLLRLFHVCNAGTERETEKEVRNYDEVQNLGLVCTVDLFPVPGPEPTRKDPKDCGSRPIVTAPSNQTPYSSSLPCQYCQEPHRQSFTFVPSHPYSTSHPQPTTVARTTVPPHSHHHSITGYNHSSTSSAPDVVYQLDDHAITESSKITQALVGATFVQPANVDYQGKKSLMFVFADLAVKIEGTFILRYRMFDIFSQSYGIPDLVIQAECYGGTFRVYSTKEFPGLQASTELTKQLARWGVRLNIRETERKRRKKGERRSLSPPFRDTGEGRAAVEGKNPYDGSDDD